jgi:glutathione S-transferase
MSLTLHFHPLSSFCQKVLIALYENGTPFTPHLVNLGDPAAHAELLKLWPIGKFPVLVDGARDRIVPETTIIIEYLDQTFPGPTRFIPTDPDVARAVRFADRFYDLHVMDPMQKIVADWLRPAASKDPLGVEQARARLATAYEVIERDMATRRWAAGDSFSMADCAAAPALFYADKIAPFGDTHRNIAAYFARLTERSSYARVLAEAQPYMHLFPQGDLPDDTTTSAPPRTGGTTSGQVAAVRRLFAAYAAKDRATMDELLAGDFRFTSPYDDAIDRATYFARCWPNSERIRRHDLETICEEGNLVFVRYRCLTVDGNEFRNTELFTFAADKVARIEVFFGASYKDGAFDRAT